MVHWQFAGTLDASPASILRSMRGAIVDARIAYPEVLHVEIKDSAGELWHLDVLPTDVVNAADRRPASK